MFGGWSLTSKALHSLMHIVNLLQTWLIETEIGVMFCLGQLGWYSLSDSSSYVCISICYLSPFHVTQNNDYNNDCFRNYPSSCSGLFSPVHKYIRNSSIWWAHSSCGVPIRTRLMCMYWTQCSMYCVPVYIVTGWPRTVVYTGHMSDNVRQQTAGGFNGTVFLALQGTILQYGGIMYCAEKPLSTR